MGKKLPTLLKDETKNGWGYVVISGAIEGLQFVKKGGQEYKCWNAEIAKQKLPEAYFAPSDEKWYTTAGKTTEIKAAEIRNILFWRAPLDLPEAVGTQKMRTMSCRRRQIMKINIVSLVKM